MPGDFSDRLPKHQARRKAKPEGASVMICFGCIRGKLRADDETGKGDNPVNQSADCGRSFQNAAAPEKSLTQMI